jgi:Flp pilus assembly protein TadG
MVLYISFPAEAFAGYPRGLRPGVRRGRTRPFYGWERCLVWRILQRIVRGPGRERGQSLVVVAISIVILVAMLGLIVDLGFFYTRRASVQTAADAAALAAARVVSQNGTQLAVWNEIDKYVQGNGGGSFTATLLPSNQELTQTASAIPSGTTGVRVKVYKDNPTYFAGVVGVTSMRSQAVATGAVVAGSSLCLGGYGIWADTWGISISDNTNDITGGMHSNLGITVSSNKNVFGQLEYVTSCSVNSNKTTYDPSTNNPLKLPAATARPVTYNIDDYDSTKNGAIALAAQAAGKYHRGTSAAILDRDTGGNRYALDGLYFIAGPCDMSSVNKIFGNFTIVATGAINISTNNCINSPYCDGLSLFSNSTINISLNNVRWNGVIYAPQGMINSSCNNVDGYYGSLIAKGIAISGNNAKICYDPTYCPAAQKAADIKLTE